MMTPRYNFTINQGSSLILPFVVKDATGKAVDLSGYTAAMQIRKTPQSKKAVDTLTTENGRMVITADEGKVEAIFPSEITMNYPAVGGLGSACGCGGNASLPLSYDLEIYSSDGLVTRVLMGQIKVSAEVTKVDMPASSSDLLVEILNSDGSSTKQVVTSFCQAVVEVQIQGIQGAKGEKGDPADVDVVDTDDIDSLFDDESGS